MNAEENFKKELSWCAIGDSFTYLNDHLDETGYRVSKGYLSRILEKVPGLKLNNIGINGSTYRDWSTQPIPKADLYTVLLGTNDWHCGFTIGSEVDFKSRNSETILGTFGILLDHIREVSPEAKILVGNPVERTDFVYLWDPENNARGSYASECGQMLSDLSSAIMKCCETENIPTVNLHDLSGFTPENLDDPYPYPPEAALMTYDGLHPTDKGCEILAELFAERICELLGCHMRTAAEKCLEDKGFGDRITKHRETIDTVEHAAAQIGCTEAEIAKTLSFLVDEKPVIVVMAGDGRVNSSKFKAQFHTKPHMIPREQVEDLIGFQPGGVCPFGIPEDIPVWLDISMKRFEYVHPAAGSEFVSVKLTPDELEKASDAVGWCDVCKGWDELEQGTA